MKNYAISQFILILFYICGYEVFASSHNITEETQKATVAEIQDITETINQAIVYQPLNSVEGKQTPEINAKNDLKLPRSETEAIPGLAEQNDVLQVLDLKIPIKIRGTTKPGNAPVYKKKNYFPGLFTAKKKKKHKLQVGGKMIKREEEEADKIRIVDGVGINIKLTP